MKIKINTIATYYPENIVENDYYVEHFKKLGQDMTHFYETCGQDKRKIVNDDSETTLTLGLKAAKKALEQANLKGTDIDLIIFTSQCPEYTIPSQSVMVHQAIEGKRDSLCFDINANCVGMVVGFDSAIKHMRESECFKRVLLIGADLASKHMSTENILYSYFGDLGCAAILERDDNEDSYIDTVYSTISEEAHIMKLPTCGMSAIYRELPKNEKKATIIPWKIDIGGEGIVQIEKLLKKNNLDVKDIKCICMSQAAIQNIEKLREHFGLNEDDVPFVGSEYGYTGTSSPFLVLAERLKKGDIKKGDKIIMWSIGASFTSCGILFEY